MLKISFNYDESLKTVSNVKVTTVDDTPKDDNINSALVKIEDCKLVLSTKALNMIDAKYGDRIAINYIQVSNEVTFPVIGKSENFFDLSAGNKLTKSNTVLFKGTQKDLLSKYGSTFELEEYKPGMFKLKPINNNE